MFGKGGPHPWNTKPGGSLLDARIEEEREHKAEKERHRGATQGADERVEYSEKNENAV